MLQGLLVAAAPGVDVDLLAKANVGGIPKALPVLSLAFVFQNVVPIISTSLEASSALPCPPIGVFCLVPWDERSVYICQYLYLLIILFFPLLLLVFIYLSIYLFISFFCYYDSLSAFQIG